jgi:hypothetical protein
VLLVGWVAWGRRVHGVGVPLLGTLLASALLFGASIVWSERVRGAAYAVVAAVAYLAAAVDPETGYDERNAYCFFVGTLFVLVAAARAFPTRRRLEEESLGTRGERALGVAAWTSSMLLVAAVVTFAAVTFVALWALGAD